MGFDFKDIKVGQNVKGKVVDVKDDLVLLDINYISEGTIYKNEYSNEELNSLKDVLKNGDLVEAQVRKIDEEKGVVLLSRKPHLRKLDYERIKEAQKTRETVVAFVAKKVNKGLILTYLGHELFMPDGQLDLDESVNKDEFVGKNIEVRITEIENVKGHERLICSRKILQKEAYAKAKKEEFESINVGDVLNGTVVNIVSFGAFIKFEYNQGLLRLGQISHVKFDNITDVLNVGDTVSVKVLEKKDGKLDVSRKALLQTPYEIYANNHKMGDNVKGVVVQKLPFGLIMQLDENVTGMLHKNEYTWNPNDNSLDYVKLNDTIECQILSIDTKKKKVSLSKKILDDNPWARVTAKKGDLVTGNVSNVTAKGLEMIVQGVVAFVPTNELTAEGRIAKIDEAFKVGDLVTGYVTEVDKEAWVMKVSIRLYELENERKQFEKYMQENNESEKAFTLGDLFKDQLENKKK